LHRAARAIVAYITRHGLGRMPEGSVLLCISDVTEGGAAGEMTPDDVAAQMAPGSLTRQLPFGAVEKLHHGDYQIGLVPGEALFAYMRQIGDDAQTLRILEDFVRHPAPLSAAVLMVDGSTGLAAPALVLPRSGGPGLLPMFWGQPKVRLLQPVASPPVTHP